MFFHAAMNKRFIRNGIHALNINRGRLEHVGEVKLEIQNIFIIDFIN